MQKSIKNSYKSIVVLTGAGISAESGIKTFRASDGLWEGHRIEDVATPSGFERNPILVQEFYNQRRAQLLQPSIKPNPAHEALARLESEFDGEFTLVTQNVDNLHERAGSINVLHMHGELLKVRCTQTGEVFICNDAITTETLCDCCQQKGTLRPHIVWFEEMPFFMERIYQTVESCDLFVSIGTSGNVYPAAGLVQIANQVGAKTLEINLEKSNVASQFNDKIYGEAGKTVPKWASELTKSLF